MTLSPLVLSPAELWWAVRLSVWLCGLPLRLRRYTLPALLHRLTPASGRLTSSSTRDGLFDSTAHAAKPALSYVEGLRANRGAVAQVLPSCPTIVCSDLDRTVQLVVWLCHRRPFRGAPFPRGCLRQALTLYYTLTHRGYPVEIHFGVHKDGEILHGHSWVTVQGTLVAERTPPEIFSIVYSYPSVPSKGGPHG